MVDTNWEVDPAKFAEPATRADVAILALQLQRVITAVEALDIADKNSDNVYTAEVRENLDKVYTALEELQQKLLGQGS